MTGLKTLLDISLSSKKLSHGHTASNGSNG